MRNVGLLICSFLLALVLVACTTEDSSTDTTSAQSLQPAPNGFSQEVANDAVEDFAAVVAAGSGVTGNVPLAAGLERARTTLDCLEDVGAISAVIYRQENFTVVPQAGVSLIVNKTRVERNILGCVTDTPFRSQGAEDIIQPCANSGEFTVSDEEFWYAFIGVGAEFCSQIEPYFNNLVNG